MTIRKAIIAAAGFGTRFLPITKTIQKEMLPVINRPVIDYLVDDLVKAGVEEIIFVINEHNLQILHFYRENKRLKKYLENMNKAHLYDEVKNLPEKANFHFVKQADKDLYGTAIPVSLAREHLKNEEAFFVLMGDDIPYHADNTSEAEEMLKTLKKSGTKNLASFVEQPKDLIHKYGVADVKNGNNGTKYLKKIIEKPTAEEAPSNLANISKYILTPEIFDIIDKQKVDEKSGELFITDTISILAETEDVVIHTPDGIYLDNGYPLGWLKANLTMAKQDPELKRDLTKYIKEEFLD